MGGGFILYKYGSSSVKGFQVGKGITSLPTTRKSIVFEKKMWAQFRQLTIIGLPEENSSEFIYEINKVVQWLEAP